MVYSVTDKVAIVTGGGRAEARTVDVTSEQDVSRLVEDTATAYGRLDFLFNNAGIAIGGDARDLTPYCTAKHALVGLSLSLRIGDPVNLAGYRPVACHKSGLRRAGG